MKFETYFVLNQEVLVRRFATTSQTSRIESCRATLASRNDNLFELTLVGANLVPFKAGEFLELHTDRFDLGVRLTGVCQNCSKSRLQFEAHDDLELFYRRKYWRTTVPIWCGILRSSQSDVPLYQVWEKAQVLRDENNLDPSIHVDIMRRSLNLSAGGVRIELNQPVRKKENCLLYLCLDDGKPTVCVLCEVVWIEPGESDDTRMCGLRFSNLLENELIRIDRYVVQHCRFDPSGNGAPLEQSHSV